MQTPPASTAPPQPEEAAAERRCPRCGASLRPEQDWCLNCGAGIGARVAAPRGWRWPVAVVAGLLALMLAAFALALVELAKHPEQVTTAPAATVAPAPVPTAAAPAPTTDPSQIPPANGGTAPTPQVGDWPAGKTGYTVVLDAASSLPAANARAKDLAGRGIPVGVLDTSGYATVAGQRYVIFSGQYAGRGEARAALGALRSQVAGARVARIAPA